MLLKRVVPSAGVYAERRHQGGLRGWRRSPSVTARPDRVQEKHKTERALRKLVKAGWRSVYDIQGRYGNLDHVTVGPGGAYLLDSKSLQGEVEIYAGAPRLKRRHDPETQADFRRVRQRVLHAAARLSENLEQSTGERIWVQAVVVLWSDFPAGVVDEGRCVFVHGAKLRGWLRARPPRLSPRQVEQIATAVQEMGQEADAAASGDPAAAGFNASRPSVS
jgi:Nuclease-related domain